MKVLSPKGRPDRASSSCCCMPGCMSQENAFAVVFGIRCSLECPRVGVIFGIWYFSLLVIN
jgi:hypothetical protein